MLLLRHLPQLFQPDAVFLRAALGIEAEAADQLLGERAARAFGEQRVFAGERDAWRVAVLVRAVAGDAHVAGDDALDLAVRPEHRVGDGDARIDLDAKRLGLLAEPAAQAAEAADIAAVIAHQRRHQKGREADAAVLGEIVEAVLAHFASEAASPARAIAAGGGRAPPDRSPRRTRYGRRPGCPSPAPRPRCPCRSRPRAA